MLDAVQRLVSHLKWADDRTLHSLRRAASIPPRALTTYAHVLGSEHTWLARLQDQSTTAAVWPELDLHGCERLARANHDALDAFAQRLEETASDDTIRYTNTRGETFDSRISDILLHMALHGSYHRGQVAMLVRADGSEPIATDYILYTRAP